MRRAAACRGIDTIDPGRDAPGLAPDRQEGFVPRRGRRLATRRHIVVSRDGDDVRRRDAERGEVLQEQVQQDLVAAGLTAILSVTGEDHPVEAALLGAQPFRQPHEHPLQGDFPRVVGELGNGHLVVIARVRRPHIRQVRVCDVQEGRGVGHRL